MRKNLWIIWGAVLASVGLYVIIGILFAGATKPDTPLVNELAVLLALVSIGELVVIALVFWKALPKAITGGKEWVVIATFLLMWALADSIAIYGLLLFLLTGDYRQFVPFLVVAVAVFLVCRPADPLFR